MSDSNPGITEVTFIKFKKDAQSCASAHLLSKLAGDESRVGNPFFSDFLLVGRRLEELGFTYYNGTVTIIELWEVQ